MISNPAPAAVAPGQSDPATRPRPGQATAPPDPRRLNSLVLRLYEAAKTDDIPTFQDRAMAIVNEAIPCNGSWWGTGMSTASGYQVHGSHLRNLPDDVPLLLNSTSEDNPMARTSAEKPDRAFLFCSDMLYAEPALAALSARMGAHQTLCVTQVDHPPCGPLRFLVITRGLNDPPFDDAEMQWLELLNPQLNAALDLCCSAQMARWRRVHSGGEVLATSDAKGFLHLSEPGVVDLLAEEWPGWSGDRLPAPLAECLAAGKDVFDGRHIHARVVWSGSRALLAIRRRHPLDSLSPQERASSLAFASGQSYKAAARTIGVAPATVRHHLRSAYGKLGVSDKAALARLVGGVMP